VRVAPPGAPSHESPLPFGVFVCDRIMGLLSSPLPLRPRPFGRALRCLSVRRPPHLSARFHPPVSFAPPPEFYDLRTALCAPTNLAALRKPKSASHRASSLIAASTAASTDCPGFSRPSYCSVLGVSHALDGLLRHCLRGLVSSRCHVQGLPYRDFSLTAEPYRVSPASSCPRAVGRRAPAV